MPHGRSRQYLTGTEPRLSYVVLKPLWDSIIWWSPHGSADPMMTTIEIQGRKSVAIRPRGGSLSPVALALLTSQCCIDTVCNEFVVNLSWNAMNHIYFLSTSCYGDSLNLKCHHAFLGAVVLWVNMLLESSSHQQPVS